MVELLRTGQNELRSTTRRLRIADILRNIISGRRRFFSLRLAHRVSNIRHATAYTENHDYYLPVLLYVMETRRNTM